MALAFYLSGTMETNSVVKLNSLGSFWSPVSSSLVYYAIKDQAPLVPQLDWMSVNTKCEATGALQMEQSCFIENGKTGY